MADMFGGTPANIGMTLLAPGRVELVTGVNLPMVMDCLFKRSAAGLDALAEAGLPLDPQDAMAMSVARELKIRLETAAAAKRFGAPMMANAIVQLATDCPPNKSRTAPTAARSPAR